MSKNIEACEWLTSAIRDLELPNLDPSYAKMRAVLSTCPPSVLLLDHTVTCLVDEDFIFCCF